MWCVAWFGTICTIEKNWKTPMEECLKRLLNSSMVGFHVFWIVEMVPNRAKHHQVWIFERSPNVYFLSHYRKVKKNIFKEDIPPEDEERSEIWWHFSDAVNSRFRISYWFFVTHLETLRTWPKFLGH